MKIFWIVLAVVLLALAITALVNYLLQRQRQARAQREGVVVYATVVSVEAVGGWAKQLAMKAIVLRLQEPGATVPREVTLRTRVAPGQKLAPGMMLTVAVDPGNPKRIYPASPEAASRLVVTGSRQERRMIKSQSTRLKPRTQVTRTTGRFPGR